MDTSVFHSGLPTFTFTSFAWNFISTLNKTSDPSVPYSNLTQNSKNWKNAKEVKMKVCYLKLKYGKWNCWSVSLSFSLWSPDNPSSSPKLGTCGIFQFFKWWKLIVFTFSIKLIWLGVGFGLQGIGLKEIATFYFLKIPPQKIPQVPGSAVISSQNAAGVCDNDGTNADALVNSRWWFSWQESFQFFSWCRLNNHSWANT